MTEPAPLSEPGSLAEAIRAVAQELAGVHRLGVAFSGGVDSSVLLALAARVLGPADTVAVLGVSPSLADSERRAAHAVADFIGVAVVEVPTYEQDLPAYQANGPDRCFHCKDELFSRIDESVVGTQRLDAVAYGENADDVRRPDRPGSLAARAHRVLRPLADAGMTKDAVRRIARELGLPCADKPAAPCLASRIPHFSPVDPAKLAQIERAEEALRSLGFSELRVRHHGGTARIELATADIERALSPSLRPAIESAVLAAGFHTVRIDPRGIQSGAFTLSLAQRDA